MDIKRAREINERLCDHTLTRKARLHLRFELWQARGVISEIVIQSCNPGMVYRFTTPGGGRRGMSTADAEKFLDGLAVGWWAAMDNAGKRHATHHATDCPGC